MFVCLPYQAFQLGKITEVNAFPKLENGDGYTPLFVGNVCESH